MFSFARYEGLGVKEIQQYLKAHHANVYEYLPEPEIELPKTPKQWIAKVCATVLEDRFANWVKAQVEARHQKVAVQKDLMIDMDPEIAAVFQQSTAVSSKYIDLHLSLTTLFVDRSEQGRLREHAAGGQQAAPHQEADRS